MWFRHSLYGALLVFVFKTAVTQHSPKNVIHVDMCASEWVNDLVCANVCKHAFAVHSLTHSNAPPLSFDFVIFPAMKYVYIIHVYMHITYNVNMFEMFIVDFMLGTTKLSSLIYQHFMCTLLFRLWKIPCSTFCAVVCVYKCVGCWLCRDFIKISF